MYAAGSGLKELVHELLRAGAKVNEKDAVCDLLTC